MRLNEWFGNKNKNKNKETVDNILTKVNRLYLRDLKIFAKKNNIKNFEKSLFNLRLGSVSMGQIVSWQAVYKNNKWGTLGTTPEWRKIEAYVESVIYSKTKHKLFSDTIPGYIHHPTAIGFPIGQHYSYIWNNQETTIMDEITHTEEIQAYLAEKLNIPFEKIGYVRREADPESRKEFILDGKRMFEEFMNDWNTNKTPDNIWEIYYRSDNFIVFPIAQFKKSGIIEELYNTLRGK